MSELNDPRVLFAAERTLLAWSRTSLTLIAFGFVMERFGLFLRFFAPGQPLLNDRGISTWIGLAFIALGGAFLVLSSRQYGRAVKMLKPTEVPEGYTVQLPFALNGMLLMMSIVLIFYILHSVLYP